MTLNGNWLRVSGESRTEEYRTWRTNVGVAGVSDVDQIEYRFIDGYLRIVGVVELAVADLRDEDHPLGVIDGSDPSPRFFKAVEDKVSWERPQGECLRLVAVKLGVPFIALVYISGRLSAGIWLRRLDVLTADWQKITLEEYERRLRTWAKEGN